MQGLASLGSICSNQKEEWVINSLNHNMYTFGIESENESHGQHC